MVGPLEGFSFDGAVQYHEGRFPPLQMDYARLIEPLGRATFAIAKYDAVLATLHNNDLLLAPLRRQEAVISSRIEGTVATLDEVLTFEAAVGDDGNVDAAKTSVRHGVIEVHSYTRALGHAQRMLAEGMPICGRVIREAHKKLLFFGRGADKQPGEFKREQNYVVDQKLKKILFVPISAEKLDQGFKRFEELVNDDAINPLIQTAVSHVEFEALHPFKDGNGRVGRMLITLTLWKKGLISGPYFYISEYIEQHRDEYIDRMRAVSLDDEWTEWCIFFLEAIEAQANENLDVAKRIVSLYEEMKDTFRELLASRWAIAALDFVFGKPVFRNNQFTATSGIPRPTAARFTNILLHYGLLSTVYPPAGRRPGVYAFEPLLRIVRS